MAAVAVVAAGGIVAGRYVGLSAVAWGVWGAGCLVAGVVCLVIGRRRVAAAAAAAAVLALGAVHVRVMGLGHEEGHVVSYTGDSTTLARLRGRIEGSPRLVRFDASLAYPRPPAVSFPLRATGIHTADGWRETTGSIQVTVEEEDIRLARGQEVELVGSIGRLRPPANPGQRDVAAEMNRRGVFVRCRVPGADGVTILSASSGPLPRRIADRAGAWASAHFARSAPGRGGLMLEALIVGRRDPALAELREAMVHAGIAHLLSISGMHLGIFLGFVYLLCRLATLTPRRSATVALLCLTGYLVLAEPRSPLLRSAIMAAAVCIGVIVHRPHAALNALGIAAVLLLAAEPMDLFAAGFQLSFGIVAALIVLVPPARELLFGRWLRTRGLMVFRGRDRVRRWLYHTAADWAISAVTMALIAYLTAVPLVAWHFGIFSPYGAPLSLLMTPLLIAAVVPGYLSLAVAPIAPNLAGALAAGAGEVAEAFARGVEAASMLPGLHFELRPVHPPWAIACYAALVAIVMMRRVRLGRVWAGAAAVVVLALTVHTQRTAAPPDAAELDLLAVGAGQCAVLRTPAGRTYILDAGSQHDRTCGERVLVPFLLHRRLPSPTAAMISHANTDHYNAIPALIRRGGFDSVYLNDYFGRVAGEAGSAAAERFLELLAEGHAAPIRLRPGQTVRLDDRTVVEVLWPPPGRSDLTVNDTSLVLRIVCDGRSVILPGDLDEVGQAALAGQGEQVRADVLILPHHGGWEKTLPAFVDAVGPSVILVSNGRELTAPARGGEAAERFYGRLRSGYRFHSTRRNGWIHVRLGKAGVGVEVMRP